MRKQTWFYLMLILYSSGACAPWWRSFSNETGGFSIQMPWPPDEKTETQETAWGPVNVHWFAVAMGGLFARYTAFFSVSYWELPEFISDSDYLSTLEDAKDRLVKTLKGSLSREHEVTLVGRPDARGLEVEINMTPNSVATARLFIADGKLYRVMVVGDADVVSSNDANRFLESFRVRMPQ